MLNIRKCLPGETDGMGIITKGWALEVNGQARVYDESYPRILRCYKVCEEELLKRRIERSTKRATL